MGEIKLPLSVPKDKKFLYRQNYELLTNKSGRLFLIAGDQKIEHLNADFFGPGIDPEDQTPEHLFKIAASAPGAVLALPLGLIARYGQDYPQVPYIVKLNGKTNIGVQEKKFSRCFWTVEDIMKLKRQSGLKIVGIGYAVHLGGVNEGKLLAAAAQAVFEAHQNGLTAVLWVYPRGQNIKEEDVNVIAGASGVAACLDADFVKVKYPYGLKDKQMAAEKFRQAVKAADRTKVIAVGGKKRPIKEILADLARQIKISGSAGLAMGRNLHQRSLKEASALTKAISAIIFKNANAKEAYAIYSGRKKNAKPARTKFLGLF